jgi:hypothetical protein
VPVCHDSDAVGLAYKHLNFAGSLHPEHTQLFRPPIIKVRDQLKSIAGNLDEHTVCAAHRQVAQC